MPLDDEGLDLDAVEAELDGPRGFLYTIPTFQNPSGRTLSLERRRRLAELARERDLLVLEDDPYGLVRFEGEPLPSLFELAGGERTSSTLVVLEDDRARAARRLVRPARRARRASSRRSRSRRTSRRCCSPGDRLRVPPPRRCSSRTSSASAACSARGATRCSTRSSASSPDARPGAGPKAATSSGSTCRRSTRRELLERAPRPTASRSCKGSDFFPPGAAASRRRGSRSASSRRTRSREGVARLARARARSRAVGLDGRGYARPRRERRSAAARAAAAAAATSDAALARPEGRARRVDREGAEAGAAEVAVIAGCIGSSCSSSPPARRRTAGTTRQR